MSEKRNQEVGICYGAYALLPGITATALKAGTVSMRHMRHVIVGEPPPPREETEAMRWGRLVHMAILEPDTFGKSVCVWEGGRRYGLEWNKWLAEHDPKMTVKPDELGELLRMSGEVHGNKRAHELIVSCQHEQSVTWIDPLYGMAKARTDGLSDAFVLDLKTTARIDSFPRQFFNLHYDIQFGWYREGTPRPESWCVALESKAPWDCVAYRVPDHVVEAGQKRAVELARKYHVCETLNQFAGIDDVGQGMPLPVPAWYGGSGEKLELNIGGESVEV